MTFAPEYVNCVLTQNFEDAKARFLAPLMAIHYAHLVMLCERGIVSREDARAIRDCLDGVSLAEVRGARYDGTAEDLFFYIDRLLVESCGEDRAGRLHIARSRNDIDMTMYRMQQREMVLALLDAGMRLRGVLLGLAEGHREDVFAAHTHTQPAQPTTIAHYLLAIVEQLERDGVRLRAAYASTNRNPLGACAITGTGFPIDRTRTTALLGFDAPAGNTYGSIATVDYMLESITATAIMLVGVGRFVQDLLLWCTAEFGYVRLADGFVQSSSIMPQKRNPVALEHARALASKAVGQATAILLGVHNTPFGDIVDTEDDLQPLVFAAFTDALRTLQLVAAALEGAEFDRARMARRAEEGWITVTELADALTRDHGLPFKASHAVASRFAAEAGRRTGESRAHVVRELAKSIAGRDIQIDDRQVSLLLSARHFVEVRTTPGGPAPAETARAIERSRGALGDERRWLDEAIARLKAAEAALAAAARAL